MSDLPRPIDSGLDPAQRIEALLRSLEAQAADPAGAEAALPAGGAAAVTDDRDPGERLLAADAWSEIPAGERGFGSAERSLAGLEPGGDPVSRLDAMADQILDALP